MSFNRNTPRTHGKPSKQQRAQTKVPVDPNTCTYRPCVDATCPKNHAPGQRQLVCPKCEFPSCKYGQQCKPPADRAHAFCHLYAGGTCPAGALKGNACQKCGFVRCSWRTNCRGGCKMCHDDIGGKCGGNATPVASEGTPDVTPVASRSQSPDLSQEVFDPSAEKYKRAITEENLQWIDSTKLKRLPPEYFEKVKVFLGAICGDAASYTEQEDRDLAMQYLGKFGICCKPGAEIVILNGKNFGRMIGSLATYTGNRTTTEPEVMSRVARRGERKDKRAVNNDSKEEPPTFNWGLNGLQRSGSDWSE